MSTCRLVRKSIIHFRPLDKLVSCKVRTRPKLLRAEDCARASVMVTAPRPLLALRRAQFHSLLYRWSCPKMADFLPSRSFLSVCFPNCLLNSNEAEQLRKSKEIDRGILKDKTYVKRLVKILLLGAGESGKSTFLKQMRIIHGQDFDQRAKEEFRATIYSNIIKGRSYKHLWQTSAKCRVGSKLNYVCRNWITKGSEDTRGQRNEV